MQYKLSQNAVALSI